jgi:hypothetical protein
MAIFTSYVEWVTDRVPTVLRNYAKNILNLAVIQGYTALDAVGEALKEYSDTSWPLDTASGWVLDQHWGPYTGVERNGDTDAAFRLFIRAKRMLNRSWGAADQALVLFRLLLPAPATLTITMFYPKNWVINIGGIDMAAAAQAVLFMTKRPSPLGGGFSVAGDNGLAVIVDAKALNYGSLYGAVGVDYDVTGWYSSIHGDPGSDVAGHAHAVGI